MLKQNKKGKWVVDHWYFGFDKEGKRKRLRMQKTFHKHKDAVAYQKQTLAAVQNREFIPPCKKTVYEMADDWFKDKFANSSKQRSTRVERTNHIEKYIKPTLGHILVQNLSVLIIEQQGRDVWKKKVVRGKEVDALVVNRVLRTLTDILAMAKRHKLIRDNPAEEAIRLDQKPLRKREIASADELGRIIDATEPGSRERVIVMMLAFSGCRHGELIGAAWSAIDLKAGLFKVRASLADGDKGKGPNIKEPKSESSKRAIPLPQELVHDLRLWKLKCPPSELDLVMPSDRGTPVRRTFVSGVLNKILKDLQIEKRLTPHCFRHTFASLLLADKRPVPEVSALLGHKNSQITYSTYAHHVPGEESMAVQNLAGNIFAPTATEVKK